jgi:hypothetical protein
LREKIYQNKNMAGSGGNLSLVANLNMMGTNEDDEHGTGSRFGSDSN